jgi:hypothetical protein
MDFLLPPHIPVAEVEWQLVDYSSLFPNTFGGEPKTYDRGQRWLARYRFENLRDADRATLMALAGQLRGKSNRLWAWDPTNFRRGSFPTSELLPNNTFANGTAGWAAGTAGSNWTLSVQGRVARSTRTQVTAVDYALLANPQVTGLVSLAPYVSRFMVLAGRGSTASGHAINDVSNAVSGAAQTSLGLLSQVFVPTTAALQPGITSLTNSGALAGDYLEFPYTSLSRCALVDGGANLLTHSSQIDNAAWTKAGATVAANAFTAPDGTATADVLVENTANSAHRVDGPNVAAGATAEDYVFAVALRDVGRAWAYVQLYSGGGANSVITYVNLAAGTLGSDTTNGAWTNRVRSIRPLGNGWHYVMIGGRKPATDAVVTARIGAASADLVPSYTGSGSNATAIWRATVARGLNSVRLVETGASALPTGTAQTGTSLHLKGLPPSASGLLLPGDRFQVGSETKIATAPLDTDAAGLGFLQFEPALRAAAADSAPVIIHEPMQKFVLAESASWPTRPGRFSDFSLVLAEAR